MWAIGGIYLLQKAGILPVPSLPDKPASEKSTRVGNAYSEPIFVMVDSEKVHTEHFEFNAKLGVEGAFKAGGGMSKDEVLSKFIEVGFAKVLPGEYLKVSPQVKDGGRVYVTVWCSSQGYIWNNVPQPENVDFMVKENGAVVGWKDQSYEAQGFDITKSAVLK
ncbi:hypothetical protein HOLleu_18313 [Holothuria leucospilota]|uniref:Uncharacterized protein n=1 Tax=Holothuria leucospilota TaxID=206669 RepID=A0A9Q1C2N5_HOLLE|nr:hypothetical protein HOLleu_18313 [Holothuria leucospilota]